MSVLATVGEIAFVVVFLLNVGLTWVLVLAIGNVGNRLSIAEKNILTMAKYFDEYAMRTEKNIVATNTGLKALAEGLAAALGLDIKVVQEGEVQKEEKPALDDSLPPKDVLKN